MDKKKAIKLATASAVAASAFVAANPHASEAAVNVDAVVKQAKASFTAVYNSYKSIASTGKLVDVKKVQAAVAKADKAYANAVATVKKSGGKKKDAYLADLEKTYKQYVVNGGKNYVKAYDTLVQLEQLHAALEDAVAKKDLAKVESNYHKLSAVLKKVEGLVKSIYGAGVRAALLENVGAAKTTKDGLIYDVTVYMKLNAADAAVKADKLADAEKALADAEKWLAQAAQLKAELTAQLTAVKAAYEAKATPKVVSVSANNLKTIAIKFNKPVDKATVTASTVALKDGSSTVDVTRTLSKDGLTLYLVANGQYTQGKEYALTLDGLKTTDGKEVTKYESTVKPLDTTVPTVDAVAVTSPKTIEIYFSEAVNFPTTAGVLTDKVQVDGINLYASNIDVDYTTGKVTLTLGAPLTAGEHKVKVMGINDFAGFPVSSKEFTVNLATDTTAPSVSAVEVVDNETIKVTYSEPVDETTVGADNSALKVVYGGTTLDVDSAERVDERTYKYSLDGVLGLGAVVDAQFKYNNIKDHYGNQVTTEQSFAFKVSDDTTAPTITGVKVNTDNTVEVTFSEAVAQVSTDDFQLIDKDGKVVAGGIADVDGKVIDGVTSDKTFVIALTDGANKYGNYTLKLVKDNNIVDKSVRQNKAGEQSFAIVLNDKVAPTILSAKYVIEDGTDANKVNTDLDSKDAKITINFSEKMDVATLTNKANYILGGQSLADISGASITTANDGKTVVITVNRASTDADIDGTFFDTLKVLALKDVAGNTIHSDFFNTDFSGFVGYGAYNPSVAFESVVDTNKVELIEKNKVKIYALAGQTFTAIDPNKLTIVAADGTDTDTNPDLVAQVTGVSIAADGKSAVLTLNKNLNADGTYGTGSATVKLLAAANAITTVDGEKTAATTDGDNPADGLFDDAYALVDKVKATLVVPTTGKLVADDTADTVTLTFDEALDETVDATAAAQALIIKDEEGKRLVPGTDYTVTVTGSTIEIDLSASTEAIEGQVTVQLTDNVVIKDIEGNFVNDFSAKASDTINVTVE